MKPWYLTRHAENILVDIFEWTIESFGERQALIYQDELIQRCEAIAAGTALTQSCAALAGDVSDEELRFTRAGEHFIIYLESDGSIFILDFLHGGSNLPEKIRRLVEDRGRD